MLLCKSKDQSKGFTVSELLIALSIFGMLSAVALPNYFNQVQKSRQSEAISTLAVLQTTLATYTDENNTTNSRCNNGTAPAWGDLNGITAIMTNNGPASDCTMLTSAITMPSGHYTIARTGNTSDSNYYEFTASDSNAPEFNAMACIDLVNGASDIEKGNNISTIQSSDLVCR
jgi:prepilin-type N-terminal cleavage/methylation domain-containing protein